MAKAYAAKFSSMQHPAAQALRLTYILYAYTSIHTPTHAMQTLGSMAVGSEFYLPMPAGTHTPPHIQTLTQAHTFTHGTEHTALGTITETCYGPYNYS